MQSIEYCAWPASIRAEVVGELRVDEVASPVAGDAHLAEVRDVEEPDCLANRSVLLQDAAARVLDRHLPATEVSQLGAQGHVTVVQRRVQRGGTVMRREATGRPFALGCGDRSRETEKA